MINLRREIRESPQAFKSKPIREIILEKFPNMWGHEEFIWGHWLLSREEVHLRFDDWGLFRTFRNQGKTPREISKITGRTLSHVQRMLKSSNEKTIRGTPQDASLWLGIDRQVCEKIKEKVDYEILLGTYFTLAIVAILDERK